MWVKMINVYCDTYIILFEGNMSDKKHTQMPLKPDNQMASMDESLGSARNVDVDKSESSMWRVITLLSYRRTKLRSLGSASLPRIVAQISSKSQSTKISSIFSNGNKPQFIIDKCNCFAWNRVSRPTHLP
ncbi:hypothetical protein PMAYCL1PPCAC_10558 [Pristionchus mayeri]|uniref:Uncharacterized protein n=1 Tax=Pristionchus mayeri TaxID=1317129 RepID=A0AAN4ZL17_9BILA|nr:hypothetical protein PMAYCL1PPCAC_10558 [Pristionchus mayeri]